jgi:hypothetical protein
VAGELDGSDFGITVRITAPQRRLQFCYDTGQHRHALRKLIARIPPVPESASPPSSPEPVLTPDIFSVSRRFDIATVLVAMFGYAVLFAGLRLIPGFPPAAMGLIGAFFAVIAVGQAVAIRWNSPRAASIIAGAVFWLAIVIIASAAYLDGCAACGLLMGALIFGPITGYLAGTLVGGVFLISHHLREANLFCRGAPQTDPNADSPWDASN